LRLGLTCLKITTALFAAHQVPISGRIGRHARPSVRTLPA